MRLPPSRKGYHTRAGSRNRYMPKRSLATAETPQSRVGRHARAGGRRSEHVLQTELDIVAIAQQADAATSLERRGVDDGVVQRKSEWIAQQGDGGLEQNRASP